MSYLAVLTFTSRSASHRHVASRPDKQDLSNSESLFQCSQTSGLGSCFKPDQGIPYYIFFLTLNIPFINVPFTVVSYKWLLAFLQFYRQQFCSTAISHLSLFIC